MPLSVCFISETSRVDRPILDPSVRYRCFHPAEALSKNGYACVVYSATKFYENPNFDFDIYVFHRPNTARSAFLKTAETLARLGRILVADYDDLIFGGEDLASISSSVKNGTLDPEAAVRAFSSNLEAMQAFSKVSVSTRRLSERVTEFNSSATVVIAPNFVPRSILSPHLEQGTAFRKRPTGNIGYFAGTRSHNKDLPIIEDVLHRVLCENNEFKLMVVGPLELPNSIASLPNVITLSVVGYWRLPHLMSMCHTVLAPLEETSFNDCKSRVKFLEAALAGCRLVATPIPDMREIGNSHLRLADCKNDWYEALSNPESSEQHNILAARNIDFLESDSNLEVPKLLEVFA